MITDYLWDGMCSKWLKDSYVWIYPFWMLIINLLSMNEIKDQARLFTKLFMAPSASSNDLKLILSMQFLKLLLD